MSRMHNIQWKWVVSGVGFIYGFQLTMSFLLSTFGVALEEHVATVQAIFATYMISSYFLGGFLVALLSPGRTLIEPVISAFGAVVLV